MKSNPIADVLNELLSREQRRLPVRMIEARAFDFSSDDDEFRLIEQMNEKSQEHIDWLGKSILRLKGQPALRGDEATALDLTWEEPVMAPPRLLAGQESLIRFYQTALQRVGADSIAVEMVSHILSRHQDDLDALRKLQDKKTWAVR